MIQRLIIAVVASRGGDQFSCSDDFGSSSGGSSLITSLGAVRS